MDDFWELPAGIVQKLILRESLIYWSRIVYNEVCRQRSLRLATATLIL
jgi:hypothetical protein